MLLLYYNYILTLVRTLHLLHMTCVCMRYLALPLEDPLGFSPLCYNIVIPVVSVVSRKNMHHNLARASSWLQSAAQLSYIHTIKYVHY